MTVAALRTPKLNDGALPDWDSAKEVQEGTSTVHARADDRLSGSWELWSVRSRTKITRAAPFPRSGSALAVGGMKEFHMRASLSTGSCSGSGIQLSAVAQTGGSSGSPGPRSNRNTSEMSRPAGKGVIRPLLAVVGLLSFAALAWLVAKHAF